MNPEKIEKILRFIIFIFVKGKDDILGFHNFYYNTKYGRKIILYHTSVVYTIARDETNVLNKFSIFENLLFYPCRCISWLDEEKNYYIYIHSRMGFENTIDIKRNGKVFEEVIEGAFMNFMEWSTNNQKA